MTWKELIINCTRSENHLSLLEALYEKDLVLKKFKGVNYKTSCRIINSFTELGLVTKNKGLYSLTNSGRLIACVTLGRFKPVKPEIKINAIIDPTEVY
ncbi:MAG TPA: hypothetical protein VI790_03285, partial [Candidatus Nanoarchaeia archaeon]|nr:hypothetical protein [Candidatus Nanoarchaeia archaeon]